MSASVATVERRTVAAARCGAARVQAVDIDPVAVAHSSAMLADNPNAAVVAEDLCDAEAVLVHPVVGRLLDVKKHPTSNKPLTVCSVDVGDGTPRQIVCGAQNHKTGDKVEYTKGTGDVTIGSLEDGTAIGSGLADPISVAAADLNGDGRDEVVAGQAPKDHAEKLRTDE